MELYIFWDKRKEKEKECDRVISNDTWQSNIIELAKTLRKQFVEMSNPRKSQIRAITS